MSQQSRRKESEGEQYGRDRSRAKCTRWGGATRERVEKGEWVKKKQLAMSEEHKIILAYYSL